MGIPPQEVDRDGTTCPYVMTYPSSPHLAAEIDRENEYLKYEGKVTMIGNFSEAFAGIFGGLLATFSLRLPFYCQILIAFIGIPAALTLQEFNVKTKIVNPLANIWKIIRYSLFTNKSLCYDIMFSGIIGAATLTLAYSQQDLGNKKCIESRG